MPVDNVKDQFVSVDHIKREAKKIKRDSGLVYNQALDAAAAKFGYRNFKHAQNQLRDGVSVPNVVPTNPVYISATWNLIGSGNPTRGEFVLKVLLHNTINQLLTPEDLIESSALIRFSLRGDNHLEHSLTILNSFNAIDYAQLYLCAAARALLFVDATYLKPCIKTLPELREALPMFPGMDHCSAWFSTQLNSFFYVDEPDEHSVAKDLKVREQWASANGLFIERSSWDGLYNPAGRTRPFLIGKIEHLNHVKAMNARIAKLPLNIFPESWDKWNHPRVKVIPARDLPKDVVLNRSDLIAVQLKKPAVASSNALSFNQTLLGQQERPNGKMPIEVHERVGIAIKQVMSTTQNRAGVYNKLDSVRATLEEWVQREYTRSELPDPKLFNLYYYGPPSDDRKKLSPADCKVLEAKLLSVELTLKNHYPVCAPLGTLLKNIAAAIKSMRSWSGYAGESAVPSQSETDAYERGVEAQIDGALITDNPYSQGTNEHDSWILGWREMLEADMEDFMMEHD